MSPIDPIEVREALEQVLRSQAFINAGRLSRLLRFVVERTLDGQGDQLKEYLLGVEVFDRPSEYDPRLDSIVRVEARRLRSKLAEYYDGEGAADAIRIRLVKGTYAPTFERRGPAAVPAPASDVPRTSAARRMPRWAIGAGVAAAVLIVVIAARVWPTAARVAKPEPIVTIAVLPVHVFSDRAEDVRLADRLTDGITSELARNASLGVAAYTNARQFQDRRRPLTEVGAALGVRVVMETTLQASHGRVDLQARLVDVELGRKLWVEDFSGAIDGLDDLERRIARDVAAVLVERSRR